MTSIEHFVHKKLSAKRLFKDVNMLEAIMARNKEFKFARDTMATMDVQDKQKLRQLTKELSQAFLRSYDLSEVNESDYELLQISIYFNFKAIAVALARKLDDPFANGLVVSYRAGEIPSEILKIPGKTQALMEIDTDEAKRLLAEAKAIARAQKSQEEQEEQQRSQEINSELADAGQGLPSSELLLRLVTPQSPEPCFEESIRKLCLVPEDLPQLTKVPDTWRDLLVAQENDAPMPWNSLWADLETTMPAVFHFLRKKCFGVGVLLRIGHSPELLYFHRFDSDEFDVGYDYGCYLGQVPLGERTPRGTKSIMSLLPEELVHFYRNVHNGWVKILFDLHGPMPVESLDYLGIDVMQEDTEIPVDKALVIMRLRGGSDAVCLATEKRTAKPKAHIHRPSWDDDLNKEFFKTFNGAIDFACEDLLDR